MWVIEHQADLESDFSAIHRVDDIYSMDGPRFFQFAARLPAYKSVMRARIEETQSRQQRRYKSSDGVVEQKSVAEVERLPGANTLFKRTVVKSDGQRL